MSILPLLIFLTIFAIILIILFSHLLFRLKLDSKRKKGSFHLLCGSLYLDWKARKIGFDLFNRKIWSGSLEKKKVKKKRRKKPKRKTKPNYTVLWQEKDTMFKTAKIILVSLFDLLKKSKLDKFMLDAKIATPDPALTGVLYGGLSSICFPVNSFLPAGSIYIHPDFKTESPQANLEMSLRTRSFDIFWALVRIFFLLPKISLIKLTRKLFKKRR